MHKAEKHRVVEELAERLRSELIKNGAKFTVVKNTLTRRAAEAAGADALLAMLEGPTAIAFVEAGGNPAGVAKALSDTARETKILTLRGGVLAGKTMSDADVESLAKLPSLEVLQAQLVGVIVAPLTQLLAVLNAPVQNLVGLIEARIEQLGGDTSGAEMPAVEETPAEAATPVEPSEPIADAAAEATEAGGAPPEQPDAAQANAEEPADGASEDTPES